MARHRKEKSKDRKSAAPAGRVGDPGNIDEYLRRRLRLLVIAVVVAAVAIGAFFWGMRRSAVPTNSPSRAVPGPRYLAEKAVVRIKDRDFTVEVARSNDDRAQGLKFRPPLADDEGMLFIYPDAARRGFWMKDTPSPLSLAYLDDDGVILELHDLAPHNTQAVPSESPARAVLELRRGRFDEIGARRGDRVEWDADLLIRAPVE